MSSAALSAICSQDAQGGGRAARAHHRVVVIVASAIASLKRCRLNTNLFEDCGRARDGVRVDWRAAAASAIAAVVAERRRGVSERGRRPLWFGRRGRRPRICGARRCCKSTARVCRRGAASFRLLVDGRGSRRSTLKPINEPSSERRTKSSPVKGVVMTRTVARWPSWRVVVAADACKHKWLKTRDD